MPSKTEPELHSPKGRASKSEAVILIKAVEGVFRKLIRLLVGRMSLKKLQQLIQIIFVEESEARLEREAPGKPPTLADTALLTGVDIRTIKKTKEIIASGKPIYREPTLLDGFMPMFKVLDLWMHHEDFFDSDSGQPRELTIQGKGATFYRLVSMALPNRGTSSYQVLKRLGNIGAVSINSADGTVRLIQESNIFTSKEVADSLDVGFSAIENLVDTVSHNIQSLLKEEAGFFQEQRQDYDLDPDTLGQVRDSKNRHTSQSENNSME